MEPSSSTTRATLLLRKGKIYAAQIALQQELLEVHRLLNSVAPIHQLPLELLVEVFLYAYNSLFVDPDAPNTLLQWLQIPSVCRHWREVVLSTPAFWRCIKVGDAPEWLSLSLACTRGVPTEIYFQQRSSFPLCKLPWILLPYASSIRLLALAVPSGERSVSPFTTSMPILSTLRVNCDDSTYRSSILLLRGTFPNLTALKLRNLELVPCGLSLYANLHHLELDNCNWSMHLGGFLFFLTSSPNLTTLVLIRCLPDAFEDVSQRESDPVPIVALPALRTLRVEYNTIGATARALEYLCVPSATCISIIGDIGAVYEYEIEDTIAGMLPVQPKSLFPSLDTMCFAELVVEDVFRLRLRNAAGVCIELGLHSGSDAASQWEDSSLTAFGLADVLEVCHGAPVTSLSMRGGWDGVNPDHWLDVFLAFPALEELALSGWGGGSDVFKGLALASDDVAPGGCCPALNTISLDGLLGRPTGRGGMQYEDVVSALRLRAKREYRQLDALELRLEFLDVEEYKEHYKTYYNQLAMLARDVSFASTLREPTYDDDLWA